MIEVIQCKRWEQAKTTHEKHVSLLSGLLTTPVRPGSRVLPTDCVAGRVDIRELAPVFRDFMQLPPDERLDATDTHGLRGVPRRFDVLKRAPRDWITVLIELARGWIENLVADHHARLGSRLRRGSR